MKHATNRELFAYWNRLRGARSAPERSDVDPGAIRHILGETFILEVDGGGAFPFRLAGTRLCTLVGHELKGFSFTGLWDEESMREISEVAQSVADDGSAAVIGAEGRTALDRTINLELLLLPLRHHGRTHARLLGAMAAASTPYWVGACPVERFALESMRVLWPSGQRRSFAATAAAGLRRIPAEPPARQIGRFVVYEGGRT